MDDSGPKNYSKYCILITWFFFLIANSIIVSWDIDPQFDLELLYIYKMLYYYCHNFKLCFKKEIIVDT